MFLWMTAAAALLILITAEDVKKRRIRKGAIAALLFLAFIRPDRSTAEMMSEALFAGIVFAAAAAFYLHSGGRGIGGGDVRLLAAEVFLLRDKELLPALLISALMLLGCLITTRGRGSEERMIPAALFLCPGMIAGLFVTFFRTFCLPL